ncbi:MAG TPA: T9SS type A sorting domain-containing protein [Membranihabitans sp.]|nr:T9SS type A sorting domain-containing protein [Membranihabitans sp.]
MRLTTLISLTCLSFFFQQLQAQNEGVEWAPIGATWHYSYRYMSTPAVDYIVMESTKDTIVNGKNARLIEGRIYSEGGFNIPATDRYDDGSYIIYQQGDSVFYLRENKFELLYDFSMKVGDTMNIVTPNGHNPSRGIDTLLHIRVDSIGVKIVNGDTLRRQVVSMNLEKYRSTYRFWGEIIEGIGIETFFLPYNDLLCDLSCPNPLRCYQDSTVFYKRTELACDTTYVFTSTEGLIPLSEIRLYPNPVFSGSGQLSIEGPDRFTWRLRDIHGGTLYHSTRESSGKETAALPSGLSPGMYLVEIQTGDQTYVRKLIVN